MTAVPSNFVWYELTTSDAPAAAAFYQAVFGWTLKDGAMPELQYTLASAGSTDASIWTRLGSATRNNSVPAVT